MSIQSAWQLSFGFLGRKPIHVEPMDEHSAAMPGCCRSANSTSESG